MSFLHPALLLLLPLAAIPIILHLITVRRLKVTELSTFQFLFDSFMRRQTRLTWMTALLTLLRTLFLLLLILAVSRPVMKKWSALFGGQRGGETILLIDASASMNARTAGLSSLDRARTAALAMVDDLDRRERLTLVRIAAGPEVLIDQVRGQRDRVRRTIEAIEPAPAEANLAAVLTHVFASRRDQGGLATVYLLTDAQAGGWDDAPQHDLADTVPDEARLIVVNVGSREPLPNVAVRGDAPADERAVVGLPVILRPRIGWFPGEPDQRGQDPVEVQVKAFIDDQEVARTALTIEPGEERSAELTYVPRRAGVLRGRYEIESDRFPDDDSYLFALPVMPTVPVVLVNGRPHADPYQNEGLYLAAALRATASRQAIAPVPEDFVRSLDIREVPESGVNDATLKTASVVILANCGALNEDAFRRLRKFVRDGGGLMIWPGDLVSARIYTDKFFPEPGPQRQSLTAARLGETVGDLDRPGTFTRLAAINFRHPALRVFSDTTAQHFGTISIYRWFPIDLPPPPANGTPLARLATGAPALVESRLGEGKVVLAAFPANNKWSNLPLKPEFVPLVLQLVNHLQRRPAVDAPAVTATAGLTEISVNSDWSGLTGKVTDNDGHSTPLTFRRAEGRMMAALEQPARKGFYEVEVTGKRRTDPAATTMTTMVAANIAPGESDFRVIDEESVEDLVPQARLKFVDASAEAQQVRGSLGEESEVWRPMIWVLFVIIGVEFALATWRGGAKLPWERAQASTARATSWLKSEDSEPPRSGGSTRATLTSVR